MIKDKPCPFKVVDITTKGYEGFVNFIHTESGFCVAMVHKKFADDLKELVSLWDNKNGKEKRKNV